MLREVVAGVEARTAERIRALEQEVAYLRDENAKLYATVNKYEAATTEPPEAEKDQQG